MNAVSTSAGVMLNVGASWSNIALLRNEEMEREKWRKRDEKAAETWRRVNEEKAARSEQ
jgi:hypothetical protein